MESDLTPSQPTPIRHTSVDRAQLHILRNRVSTLVLFSSAPPPIDPLRLSPVYPPRALAVMSIPNVVEIGDRPG
jgi:hypothetical protein